MKCTALFFFGFCSLLLLANAAQAAPPRPVQLRCEGRSNPVGVDVLQPRLGWILAREDKGMRGQKQTAYRILVSTSREGLEHDSGDLWDSGKVDSSAMSFIAYQGRKLGDCQQAYWKVCVWDERGSLSPWSETAKWTMGLLDETSWKGKWITSPDMVNVIATVGFRSSSEKTADAVKWVQIDLGREVIMDRVVLAPMNRPGNPGYGFPVRFKVETDNDPLFSNAKSIVDNTRADFANPGIKPVSFPVKGLRGRYVRVTTTRLFPMDAQSYGMALRQLAVYCGETNVARQAPVETEDSIEDGGWGRIGLTDGVLTSDPNDVGQNARFADSLLLRRAFAVKPKLRRALVLVSGLGQYELFLNGKKIGRDLLTPGWTNYQRTVLYDAYDITTALSPGENVAGLILGNGIYRITAKEDRYTRNYRLSYGPLKAIAQFYLEYEDGKVQTIVTDGDWKVLSGPITFGNIYGGEDYDARRVPPGWGQSGFEDKTWKPAQTVPGPGGQLRGLSCAAEPVRAIEALKPVIERAIRPGVTVYDFGQNTALMPKIRITGETGSRVRIIPSELVTSSGEIDDPMCHGKGYWTYTLSGKGEEQWFPQFFYRGARYFQVECLPADSRQSLPVVKKIEGVVVHGDVEPVGQFTCSNELFNRIYALVRWAQVSNIVSILTDCPQREKFGWVEQNHLNGPALRYNFNLQALLGKGVHDMADTQKAGGLVPNIAPEYAVFGGTKYGGGFRSSPEWGSAFVIVPWQQYLYDGDIGLIRKHYDQMKAYIGYLESRAQDDILDFGLGDWYDLGPNPPGYAQLTPVAFTATAFYFYDTWLLSKMAALLDKREDSIQLEKKAGQIRHSFNRRFFAPAKGYYATGSQCAQAMALVMPLAEEKDRSSVLQQLVTDVQKNGLTAGDVGYRYLIRALADAGRSDVLFALNNQSGKPGYGYNLKMGATAMTESWDARRSVSQNHFMLGQINEWFYHDLAGIQPDPEGVGFRKIILKPAMIPGLSWVHASYNSASGRIVSEWKRTPGSIELKVEIPVNTSATLYLSAPDTESIQEGGRRLDKVEGVRVEKEDGRMVVLNLESGIYRFNITH
jgi:alpha-L-rhamnosidase